MSAESWHASPDFDCRVLMSHGLLFPSCFLQFTCLSRLQKNTMAYVGPTAHSVTVKDVVKADWMDGAAFGRSDS